MFSSYLVLSIHLKCCRRLPYFDLSILGKLEEQVKHSSDRGHSFEETSREPSKYYCEYFISQNIIIYGFKGGTIS